MGALFTSISTVCELGSFCFLELQRYRGTKLRNRFAMESFIFSPSLILFLILLCTHNVPSIIGRTGALCAKMGVKKLVKLV